MGGVKLPDGCPLIGIVREAYGDKKYSGKKGIKSLRNFLALKDDQYCADIYYINTQGKGILYERKGKDIKHALEQLEFIARIIKDKNMPLDKMFTDATIPPQHKALFQFRNLQSYGGRVLIKKWLNQGKGRVAEVSGVVIYGIN